MSLLQMSVTGGVMILAITVLRALAMNHVPKKTFLALWGAALLRLATELEGHPDNVAPALLGGLTASIMDGDSVLAMRCPLSEKLRFMALIPDFELSTRRARAALPSQVPLADAVFNASRAAVLLRALETGDMRAVSAAMDDRLHQPYRAPLIDEYEEEK